MNTVLTRDSNQQKWRETFKDVYKKLIGGKIANANTTIAIPSRSIDIIYLSKGIIINTIEESLANHAYRTTAKSLKILNQNHDDTLLESIIMSYNTIASELSKRKFDTLFLHGVIFNIVNENIKDLKPSFADTLATTEISELHLNSPRLARKLAKAWPHLAISKRLLNAQTVAAEDTRSMTFEPNMLEQETTKSRFTYESPKTAQKYKRIAHPLKEDSSLPTLKANFSYYQYQGVVKLYTNDNTVIKRVLPYLSRLGGNVAGSCITIPRKYSVHELEVLFLEHSKVEAHFEIAEKTRGEYLKNGLAKSYSKSEQKVLDEMVSFGRYRGGKWDDIELIYLHWILKTFDYEHPFHKQADKVMKIKFVLE
jgi:hypothetical protein